MITEYIDKIRNAILGKDVKAAIADGLEQAYNDALDAGNVGVEVSNARGDYSSLGERLNAEDSAIAEMNTIVSAVNITVSTSEPETTLPDGQIVVIYED